MANQLDRQIRETPERVQTGQDVINRAMLSDTRKKAGTTGTQGEMTYGADPGYGGA
jgi:hypothetical protein